MSQLFNTPGKHNSDLELIETILGTKYPYGRIADEILLCCQDDDITFQELLSFDEGSLTDIIDTWDFNTYGKKKVVIRGKLIKGIKKLYKERSSHKLNYKHVQSNPNNINHNQDNRIPLTKDETTAMESFTSCKNKIEKKILALNNGIYTLNCKLTSYETEHVNTIKREFDELRQILDEAETTAIDQVKSYFDQERKQMVTCVKQVKDRSKQIIDLFNKTKKECTKNIDKYSFYDIKTRIDENCKIINSGKKSMKLLQREMERMPNYYKLSTLENSNPLKLIVNDKNKREYEQYVDEMITIRTAIATRHRNRDQDREWRGRDRDRSSSRSSEY